MINFHAIKIKTPLERGGEEMPKQYRKKPVVIEAVQWSGRNIEEVEGFVPPESLDYEPGVKTLHIKTLEGRMFAKHWDYIIKGVKGEFYPCKPDIFEATYETVE
jgi:hypothetical protein